MHACTSNETRRRGPHFSNRWRESVSWTRVRGGIRIDQRNGRVLVPCGRASWGSSSGQSHSGAAAQRKEAPFSVTAAPVPRDLRDPHPRQGSPAAPSRAIARHRAGTAQRRAMSEPRETRCAAATARRHGIGEAFVSHGKSRGRSRAPQLCDFTAGSSNKKKAEYSTLVPLAASTSMPSDCFASATKQAKEAVLANKQPPCCTGCTAHNTVSSS